MTVYYQPGRYVCRVGQQGWQESSTGKPMILLKVFPLTKLIQGAEGPEEDPINGQYDRTIRLVVNAENEKAMDFLLKKLRHAGFDGDSFADLNLEGREVECTCEPRQYEGKDVEQWDLALPPLESKPLQPMDAKVARKLDTLFGKRLKEKPKPSSGPKPQAVEQPAAMQQGIPVDEIPF